MCTPHGQCPLPRCAPVHRSQGPNLAGAEEGQQNTSSDSHSDSKSDVSSALPTEGEGRTEEEGGHTPGVGPSQGTPGVW